MTHDDDPIAEIDRDYFFVQVSSSSFVHFPPISTSDMCSTFVALTFVSEVANPGRCTIAIANANTARPIGTRRPRS